jgi:DNA-directed RNA polymerase sigma subunit (sigma70/sigma32)
MRTPIDRNKKILARYAELRSFAAVGREFGLSRQRIHQIVTGYNPGQRLLRKARQGKGQ